MISRRKFTTMASALLCGSFKNILPSPLLESGVFIHEPTTQDVSRFVNIMIGTGGHGHCYPGATVPFGMVQLSPDTFNKGWDWCSGYNYSDSSIMGFSHTHLSGTGIGDMLDFLIMPGTGPVKTIPGTRENPDEGYRSRFSHEDERASPGYYSVTLLDYSIHAELTATERAGLHRYTFPADQSSHFILDLDHGYADGPGVVQWASLKLMGDTVLGGKSTLRWAKGREIYFAMKFSRPWDRVEILVDGKPLESTIDEIKSQSIKAVFHFATKDQEKILVKTGISGVNSDGAQLNLNREIPAWDFNGIRARASELWEKELSRIQVAGGTERQREIFYTALYHSFLAPTTFDDVDGKYRGMDGAVHQLAQGERNYSTFSTWDTYRALHPLFTIVQPEKVPGMVNCLIRMAGQSPLGMPIWPLQAKDTGTMTGYHSASIIAEAVQKKFGGIDIASAYQVMKREAAESQVRGLPLYRQYGFIPCDLDSQSVSKSLDYNYNDWALACVATAFGAKEDAENYRTRSLNYKNLYDSATRFMRPKLANGEWAEPFAANEMGHSKRWRDYTESNPWQATFAVQHDPNGLAHLFGGRKMLEERLDDLFGASSAQPADAPSDIAGLVGQYAHGNEPSHHIAYLYVYAGAAHKTQDRIANLLETMYDNKPDGLVGNEDCGQMSAWYVMSAMGFYAVDPINGSYVFGTPIFDKVTIDVGRGRRFILTTRRQSANEKYIAAIRWKGAAYDKLWFRHEDIVGGGSFELKMSAKPNAEFASGSESAPPSLSPAQTT